MAIEKVLWFNAVQTINDNFEDVDTRLEAIGDITQATAVANLSASTNITAVPGTFADLASVQSYLAGANVIPNIEARIDAVEGKINSLLTALRTAGIIATP